MKSMTCKELGGACDEVFTADTFDQIAELSKQHGREMYAKKDAAHLAAMQAMRELMHDPEALSRWMVEKRAAFERK